MKAAPRYGGGRESPASSVGAYSSRFGQAPGLSSSQATPSGMTSPPPRVNSMGRPLMGTPDEIEASRGTARRHYLELNDFLTEQGRQPPPARNSSRDKLTRLTRQQFQELSTDVYDELLRRKDAPKSEPFLPVQDGFHPKRNQARQKLATLPDSRYRELASDVFFELERRYPEFRDDVVQRHSPPSRAPLPPRAESSTAANEVLVPNKSNIVEEDVSLPAPPPKPTSPPQDNGRYYSRGPANNDDQRSRISEGSSIGGKLLANYANRSDRASIDQEQLDKLKAEYEYKLATSQQRITSLETDLTEARAEAKQSRLAAQEAATRGGRDSGRIRELEEELRSHRQRYDDQSGTLRTLQREVDEHKSALSRSREASVDTSRLQRDLDEARAAVAERDEVIDDLRLEVKGMLDELRDLNGRQDDHLADRERDADAIRQLEGQVTAFKQRYEAVKTELRTARRTSQLFVPSPDQLDFLPASDDGAIADIYVTAFQSSIDSLLVAGRSDKPSSVLSMTKAVVQAVSRLDEDVTRYEDRRDHDLGDEDEERLQALKAKCNATLSNLVTAAKNHAAGYGMSPVSLLDAAASHLSVTVVDLVRLVRIRRASQAELGEDGRPLPSPLPRDEAPPPLGVHTSPPKANGVNGSSATPSRLDALRSRGNVSPPSSSRASPVSSIAESSRTYERAVPQRQNTQDSVASYSQEARYGGAASAEPSVRSMGSLPPTQPLASAFGARSGEDARGTPTSFSARLANGAGATLGEDQRGRSGGSLASPDFERPPLSAGLRATESPYDDPSFGNNPAYFNADSFDELREYCEQQTEAIVHSIQSLLAAVRSGASGEEIHENLSQIITVVSSIVGVAKDNLPPTGKRDGADILRDLAESCDKLSAMQAASHESFSKETKQKLASVSFGAAKALKALNSYLAREAAELS